jgi:hypothetical protein
VVAVRKKDGNTAKRAASIRSEIFLRYEAIS